MPTILCAEKGKQAGGAGFWEPGFADLGDRTLAGWAKHLTGLPIIAVGGAGLDRAGIKEAEAVPLDHVAGPLARGEFDVLAVGRALLADPDWLQKVRQGHEGHCVGYNKSLLETLF